jgi:hypothetical protein
MKDNRTYLASALATQHEKRIAVAIAIASLLAFLAIVPFVRVHLPEIPGVYSKL